MSEGRRGPSLHRFALALKPFRRGGWHVPQQSPKTRNTSKNSEKSHRASLARLQRILNLFRGEAMAGKYVLVCTKPHREWMLGQLTGARGERIRMTNQVFTSIEEAEWFVFKERWAKYTNETLPDSVQPARLTAGRGRK